MIFQIKSLYLYLALLFPLNCFCDEAGEKHFSTGFRAGITYRMGSTVNRVGLFAGGFILRDWQQLNVEGQLFLNGSSFGPPHQGPEVQLSAFFLAGFGNSFADSLELHFLTANRTRRGFHAGYGVNFYIDRIWTSQVSGTAAAGAYNVQLVVENDVLIFRAQDKYRTGSIGLWYASGATRAGAAVILWTGNTSGAPVFYDESYPSKHGYKDLSQKKYGRFSEGIFSVVAEHRLQNKQQLHLQAGVNHERVRHFFQNRMIHDMPILPDNWFTAKNPHYPMLDDNGLPYLFWNWQQLKKPQPFFQFGMNDSGFY